MVPPINSNFRPSLSTCTFEYRTSTNVAPRSHDRVTFQNANVRHVSDNVFKGQYYLEKSYLLGLVLSDCMSHVVIAQVQCLAWAGKLD